MTSIIPVLLKPSATLLVDDDLFFIDNIKRLLPKDITTAIIHQDKFDNLYNSNLFSISGIPLDDSSLNSAKSLTALFKSASELPVSTIVMDHYMIPKNGLEILSSIKSPFVQKILISNILTNKEALEAVNQGVIDFYLCKMDPHFTANLTKSIYEAQNRFFSTISLTIQNFFSGDNPLTEKGTMKIFHDIKENFNMAYYEGNDNLRKFSFTDSSATKAVTMQIIPEEELAEILNSHQAESASPEILNIIKAGKMLPCFRSKSLPDGDVWDKFLQPAQSFQGKRKYFYSIYTEDENELS